MLIEARLAFWASSHIAEFGDVALLGRAGKANFRRFGSHQDMDA